MTFQNPFFLRLIGGSIAVAGSFASAADTFPPEQIEFFEKNVRPVLAENCYSCHGGHKHENGLRLDMRSAVIRGSDYGKVVEPGNPGASKLIKAINHVAGVEAMPKKADKLKAEDIAALEKWVQMGLPWPEEKVLAEGHEKADPMKHWAFQPVKKPAGTVDSMVGAKLKAAGLDFAPAADAASLCRRIHVTLTGLQPSFEEVQAFEQATAKDAKAATDALVDKLLASPAYGERWGRVWLDVARYADTDGYQVAGKNTRYPYAYTYRDWVVKALNADMPYDQFLKYQLAADKMVPAGSNDPHLAALGYLSVGDRFISNKDLQTDDRIDVVSRGMLGLTVGCARCHDHKFDPIPARDYYALYSVFNSSEMPEADAFPVIGKAAKEEDAKDYDAKVAEIAKKEFDFKKKVYDEVRTPERVAEYLAFAQEAATIKDRNTLKGRAGALKLRDKVADQWGDFLKRHALKSKPHPVMLAWKEFAFLPADQFEAKAPEVVKAMIKPGSTLNAVARNELAKRPAPKKFEEVAALYADIFNTCLAGKEPDNDDWKQVREILQAAPCPMSVPVEQANLFFTRKDLTQTVKTANERVKLETEHPGAPPRAMVMLDREKPADVSIFIRGNPSRRGAVAPRGWLTMFGGESFKEGSGRLELAEKIASKDNPLTARVIVNRVWTQHFGRPLVGQTSDFGVQTEKPLQQDVLDYLAATFMEDGWSLKKLHQRILNSRAYQQTALSTPEKNLKDADNDLISRQNRQRLDYESMRDAMLQVAGDLDRAQMGGRAVLLNDKLADSRRSLYLLVDRYEQATVPAMFDFANPDNHSPMRYVTTVPQQALFLMNSPFMQQRSTKLAAETPVKGSTIDSESIQALYQRVLLRKAGPEEVEMAQRFCNDAKELSTRSAAFVWTYGSGKVEKDAATGKVSLGGFVPFPHFGKVGQSTYRWTPDKVHPSKEFGHLYIGAGNGHPGKEVAVVMQWSSPFEKEKIFISGLLKRSSPKGNGVRAWIISNRAGKIREELIKPASNLELNAEIEVTQDEVLSFVVESENGSTDSDSFSWAPKIERKDASGVLALVTNAETDFCGPDLWPVKRPKPQSALAQLAQVLMMSNEFQFVD
ncbi:cytochrome c [Prosthecobacter fusiformis]|uniref:Cytochrome c n=1 Tax=Prosthecobacter fusiformis TaxID=48464 RepID=A0A4V3FI79_9BACT|nr:PSD1 and planctomycete cytochrome C domain-containing protein [Prosthecobacter fusiformis]TDU81433.1 cytochrome c [Prosthecobacter fusiformis]